MPLTTQVDGKYVNGSPTPNNQIKAKWFNDFKDLLTGNMYDQVVTFRTDVVVRAISGGPGAPTLALAAGAALSIGAYQYGITYLDASGGETWRGAAASITTTSGNQAVNISAIPIGPSGTTKRNIYRTAVGGSTYLLVATLNDNTTTTYSDTTADASLGTQQPPTHPSFGGVAIQDYNGTVKARLFTDGAVSFDNGNITSDGSGNLSASTFVGSIKDTAAAASALAIHDTGTTMQFKPTGTGRGLLFSVRDSGGALHNGMTLDTSGNVSITGTTSLDNGAITTDGSGNIGFTLGPTLTSRQSGSLNGFTFKTWSGTGAINALSVGGNLSNSYAVSIDQTGILYLGGALSGSGIVSTMQSGASSLGFTFKTWSGSAAVIPFSVGAQYNSALSWVDNSGNFNGPIGGGIPTTRNGAALSVPIFTGTTTPVNPPTGAIWIKA